MFKAHANAGRSRSWDQTEYDNPGGTLCEPASLSSTDGRREGARKRGRERHRQIDTEKGKGSHLQPTSLLTSFSGCGTHGSSGHNETSFCEY